MYFIVPLLFALLGQSDSKQARRADQQSAQAATTPSTKPGIVRGHIYANDTGLGVKHADVSLRPQGRFQPQDQSSDPQGGFEFRNVEPGAYTLSCNKSGFVGSSYGAKSNQPPLTFNVGENQEVKDIDCRMQRGGAITGVVTNDEVRRVGYGNVQVMQKQYRPGQATPSGRNSAQTDDRGRYRVFDLPPGRYYVQATRRGAGPTATRDTAYATVIYPGATRMQDAQALQLPPGGEVSGIDMVLKTVPTFNVSGKVMDLAAGRPVAGGNVMAMNEDVFSTMGGGGGMGNGQIKPDGTFQLRGLSPGHYRLQVMALGEGGGPGGGRGGPRVGAAQVGAPGQPQQGPRTFTKAIDVGQANITDLVIQIGPGATVKGKITAEGGDLPTGMRVNLISRGDGGVAGAMAMAFRGPGMASAGEVSADGSFELADVQAGAYDISFNNRVAGPNGRGGFVQGGNGNSGFFLSGLTSGGADALDTGVVIPEGSSITQVTATIDFRSSSVTGRALAEDGTPMPGVPVVLISADPKKRLIDRYFKTTHADSTGSYRFNGVIPGSYLVVLWPESDPNQVQDPDLMVQLEKHATRVSVERSATATQDLKMTSELRVIAQTFAQ